VPSWVRLGFFLGSPGAPHAGLACGSWVCLGFASGSPWPFLAFAFAFSRLCLCLFSPLPLPFLALAFAFSRPCLCLFSPLPLPFLALASVVAGLQTGSWVPLVLAGAKHFYPELRRGRAPCPHNLCVLAILECGGSPPLLQLHAPPTNPTSSTRRAPATITPDSALWFLFSAYLWHSHTCLP